MSKLGYKIRSFFTRPTSPALTEGWTRVSGSGTQVIPPYDAYAQIFPYSNAIAGRFATIIPYAVDAQGERINPAPPALKALYAPNDQFSCLEFLKFIANSILTQSHLDILVWTNQGGYIQPGGEITSDNIAGYTFLPQDSRQWDSSHTTWTHRVTMTINGRLETRTFTRNETIALSYSTHPLDPSRGISPAQTIRKWANVDDMIADYERGFFANGAVPAGMMGIVSATADDFTRTKNQLEQAFQGAGHNNGVVYNMIPVDPLSGKPSDTGKLVWVPFQQANNSLDLSSLNDVVNTRLASALAVPDIVRGIDNGQTYANAEQAERAFIENTLKPLCMTVWDKFQFELDRITGGLGYGINFTLDIPAQTDMRKVQADTQAVQVDTLIKLINAGASVETAVKALRLPEEYSALELEPATPSLFVKPEAPQIVPQIQASKDDDVKTEPVKPDVEESTVSKASKLVRKFYRDLIDLNLAAHSFAKTDVDSVEIQAELVDGLFSVYEPQIVAYANSTGKTIIQAMQELAKTNPDIAKILDAWTPSQIAQLVGWETLPDTFEKAYRKQLTKTVTAVTGTANKSIAKIIAQGIKDKLDYKELVHQLYELLDDDRAELLAGNELRNAERLGNLYSAQNLSKKTGVPLKKVWHTSGLDAGSEQKPCPFCEHMNGKVVGLAESFMDEGDSVDIDGETFTNDYISMITAAAHPRCRCTQTYEVA